MKRIAAYSLLIISCAGCVASSLLLAEVRFAGPSSFLAGGFMFFCILCITSLIMAEYAGDEYGSAMSLLLAFIGAAGLLFTIAGAAFVFATAGRPFLPLNVSVVLLALLLFITGLVLLKKSNGTGRTPGMLLHDLRNRWNTPIHRISAVIYVLFMLILLYSLYATVTIARLRQGDAPVTAVELVDRFYDTPAGNIELPASPLVAGSPSAPVNVAVFFDFECPACRAFYEIQEKVLVKYQGRVRFTYYHYPLDSSCNAEMKRKLHPDACMIARAMTTAALRGGFRQALDDYFGKGPGREASRWLESVKAAFGPGFSGQMNSAEVNRILNEHLDFAGKNGISGTPTMFIGGRRNVGYLPQEVMERIIDRELKTK